MSPKNHHRGHLPAVSTLTQTIYRGGGGAGVGGQMSDDTWYLGQRYCPPRQLNGGCREAVMDSNLIGLLVQRIAMAEPVNELMCR